MEGGYGVMVLWPATDSGGMAMVLWFYVLWRIYLSIYLWLTTPLFTRRTISIPIYGGMEMSSVFFSIMSYFFLCWLFSSVLFCSMLYYLLLVLVLFYFFSYVFVVFVWCFFFFFFFVMVFLFFGYLVWFAVVRSGAFLGFVGGDTFFFCFVVWWLCGDFCGYFWLMCG